MSQLQITDLVLVNSEYDQVQDITEYDYRNIMGGCGEDKRNEKRRYDGSNYYHHKAVTTTIPSIEMHPNCPPLIRGEI